MEDSQDSFNEVVVQIFDESFGTSAIIAEQDVAIAIYGIDNTGPCLKFLSLNRYLTEIMGTVSPYEILQKFGTTSMLAITQGNQYFESVNILQLGKLSHLKAIIISLVFDDDPELPVHHRYLQIAIITHINHLQNIKLLKIEDQLLVSSKYCLNPYFSNHNLELSAVAYDLKKQMINILNGNWFHYSL